MSLPRIDPRIRVAERVRLVRARLRFPAFWCALGTLLWTGSLGVWLARAGTTTARGVSAASLILLGVGVVAFSLASERIWKNPRRALARVLRPLDAATRSKLDRALRLYEGLRDERARDQSAPGTSIELAELHVSSLLDALPAAQLDRAHALRASRLRRVGLGLVLTSFLLFTFAGLEILEGGLVLFARRGVAPFPLPYVEDGVVLYELPQHLRTSGPALVAFGPEIDVPEGSTIVFRILPRVLGRQLVLTDGLREVPFVSEGDGTFVARLVATDAADYRVAARLGDVLVFDSFERRVLPERDRPPSVALKGAPSTMKLEELERLELEFVALDDHGLSEVSLVVETGRQEQRTELARLDGKQLKYLGGHAVTRSHPLLARAFLPVRVRIEARDADAVNGPKWGKSEAIVLLPPAIGADAARRYSLLREFRSELTRALAGEIAAQTQPAFEKQKQRADSLEELSARLTSIEGRLGEGVDVPEASLRFLRAQLEALGQKGTNASSFEMVLLASDALLGSFSQREAARVSNELAGALEELAVVARDGRKGSEVAAVSVHRNLTDRLDLARAGAVELGALGVLGRDLGSVAEADLGRGRVALDEKSYERLERIALHLAARLRRANPSFGAKGAGGVESGPPSGAQSGSGEASGEGSGNPSNAPEDFNRLEQRAEELADEHAKGLSQLERMLDEARRAAEQDAGNRPEWKKEADALRSALRGLPEVGGDPGTPSSEAALGKNQGEAMADALEAGDLERAAERGQEARAALERAAQLAEQSGAMFAPGELQSARRAVEEALGRVEQGRREFEQARERGLGSELGQLEGRERELAKKTRELAQQSGTGEAPLPSQSRDALERASRLMESAADALRSGNASEGRALAEKAQRELEQSISQGESSEKSDAPSESEGEGAFNKKGDVPEREKKDRARRFRERVQKGLGQGSGAFGPAVQRYAEELQ